MCRYECYYGGRRRPVRFFTAHKFTIKRNDNKAVSGRDRCTNRNGVPWRVSDVSRVGAINDAVHRHATTYGAANLATLSGRPADTTRPPDGTPPRPDGIRGHAPSGPILQDISCSPCFARIPVLALPTPRLRSRSRRPRRIRQAAPAAASSAQRRSPHSPYIG